MRMSTGPSCFSVCRQSRVEVGYLFNQIFEVRKFHSICNTCAYFIPKLLAFLSCLIDIFLCTRRDHYVRASLSECQGRRLSNSTPAASNLHQQHKRTCKPRQLYLSARL